MKKIIFGISIIFFSLFYSYSFASITVTGSAPQFNPADYSGPAQLAIIALNTSIQTAFDQNLVDAQARLSGLSSQDKLSKGFANSSVYASKSSALWGYQGYSAFAVMAGATIGIQLPISLSTNIMKMYDEASKVGDKVQEEGDVLIGAAPSFSLNVGIRAGYILPLLPKDMYINVKWFSWSGVIPSGKSDFEFTTHNVAIGANYQHYGW